MCAFPYACFFGSFLTAQKGKCIAGGVFLSMGFDYRVAVDSAHTYFHLNELDNGFGLPVPLINLIANRTGVSFSAGLMVSTGGPNARKSFINFKLGLEFKGKN